MRLAGSWSLLLAASFTSGLAQAQPATSSVSASPPEPAPPPPPPPEPAPAAPPPASGDTNTSSTTAADVAPESAESSPAEATSPALSHSEQTTPVGANPLPDGEPATDFRRDFSALPLTLEARFGFNARLGSSFDAAAQEEHWGPSYGFASYISWRPEFALGLELDHTDLGRVRALSGQTSIDNEYSATGAWLGARVFPIRSERWDFFVNLRVGMVWQHVDALGTRGEGMSITEPAQSFACTDWDGPGIGLGGALGLAYRVGRHIAFVSRLDLNGERLSGEALGTCADGIGSVASLGGSVGLAFEFETAPK
ncbi:MAG TPA: hypothetical protein VER12_16720 [Polyangiaceae bacterium]|nr:hypothetical protein [Polyangiaceae bacterium]